jgi:hypothetical protein
MFVADSACRDTRASDANVCRRGTCNGNTHACIDAAANQGLCGLLHVSASKAERLLISVVASSPSTLSVETTKGKKCLLWARQTSRYFAFFSRSWLVRLDVSLTFVIDD